MSLEYFFRKLLVLGANRIQRISMKLDISSEVIDMVSGRQKGKFFASGDGDELEIINIRGLCDLIPQSDLDGVQVLYA